MSFGIIAGCAATLRPLASSLPSHRRSKYRPSGRPGGLNNKSTNLRGSMANRRNTGGAASVGVAAHSSHYWSKPYYYNSSSSSGARAERVRSHPTSLSTADTMSSSKPPGSCYGIDSDPDFTREMRSRGHHPGHGHNYRHPTGGTGSAGGDSTAMVAAAAAAAGRGLRNGRSGVGGGQHPSSSSATGNSMLFSPPPSGVHVQTSIEVRREETHGVITRTDDISSGGGRIFPLQGDRVVTINGPVSQGLSAHTY